MEFFNKAKSVRLRSHHKKYLLADDDRESVFQDRYGSTKNAKWTVESDGGAVVRLKSCYGRYLTAGAEQFLLGVTGRKILQTLPQKPDPSVEWESIRDGAKVRLKTRYGTYLRANGGLPPWRNSITHDIPNRHTGWILWEVDVIEVRPDSPKKVPPQSQPLDSKFRKKVSPPSELLDPRLRKKVLPPPPPPSEPLDLGFIKKAPPPPSEPLDSEFVKKVLPPPPPPPFEPLDSEFVKKVLPPPPPPPPEPLDSEIIKEEVSPPSEPLDSDLSSSSFHLRSPELSQVEANDSFDGSAVKSEGRIIHYNVADDDGNVDDGIEGDSFHFKGNGLEELSQRLEDETGLEGIIVCSRNPLNGKLYPLRLALPPNIASMNIVVVPSTTKVARDFVEGSRAST